MNELKFKKLLASIFIVMLVFFSLSNVCFAEDEEETESLTCVEVVEQEEGGFFEEIVAKMIAGIADAVFDITTSEDFGVGFKDYDQLIFGVGESYLSPFSQSQWSNIRQWYLRMTLVAGPIMIIAVVVNSYKIIIAGFSRDKRDEAKDNLLRLFFGGCAIGLAPLFVKFLLLLNHSLTSILLNSTTLGSLDSCIGRQYLSQISTGNAIATAIVIAMFAYLFVKLNIKFIIRQFTILVFTVFTPVIAVMWIINKKTIGAAIWFGQIFINVFMQFIYCFLFLIYLAFVSTTSGWAVSLLWAMMILPLGDALQNTMQNLVSRIAGVNNEELAMRGIGMGAALGHTVKSIAYQFKSNDTNGGSNIAGGIMNTARKVTNMGTTNMSTSNMQTSSLNTSTINKTNDSTLKTENLNSSVINKNNFKTGITRAYNVSKDVLKLGRYMADGTKINESPTSNNFNKYSNKNDKFKMKQNEDRDLNATHNVFNKIKEDDANE